MKDGREKKKRGRPAIIEPISSYERPAGTPPHSFLLYFCLTEITENTENASDIRLMC